MIIKKQVKLVLSSSLLTIFIFSNCLNNNKIFQEKDIYDKDWKKGKELFYKNCTYCHSSKEQGAIFMNYISLTKNKEIQYKVVKLKDVLKDRNHFSKGIEIEKFTNDEYRNLVHFIETINEVRVTN